MIVPEKLHYRALGSGPPLYILHGLFGSGRNWAGIAHELSDSFEVILVDLRNHGDSSHADSMTYTDMAADVSHLITSRKQSPVDILGHSMGGKTAMALALTAPSLINRLIVADIAPVRYPSDYRNLIGIMKSLPVAKLGERVEADRILAENITDPAIRQFLLQNLVRDKHGYRWRINLGAIEQNLHELCSFPEVPANRRFRRKCLFLAGSESG